MTDRPMMMCGHTANATTAGEPCCAVCLGPASRTINPNYKPPAEGRMMRCSYASRPEHAERHPGGGSERGRTFESVRPSNPQAAFFEARPDEAEDRFYCGCWGWD